MQLRVAYPFNTVQMLEYVVHQQYMWTFNCFILHNRRVFTHKNKQRTNIWSYMRTLQSSYDYYNFVVILEE